MRQFMPYLLIGLGGFAGANARYLVSGWIGAALNTRFPLGTLVVNVSGCFLLGVLGVVLAQRWPDHPQPLQWLLATGFLGAYTTFSAFEWDNHALLLDGRWLLMALNVALSVLIGLLAVRVGIVVAKSVL
ncbi:MAG: fluoride efflux transporter CrcB [Nitrospiria bacterium]